MFGGGRQTFDETVKLVEQWIPRRKYRTELKFRDDLQDYLDAELNRGGGGLLGGGGGDHVVTVEHGQVNADVCVNGEIGIELKRDLTNSQTDRLRGQIDSYMDHYPFVIACACGIKDMDGWRELKNRFGRQSAGLGGMGMGMDQPEVVFIHKRKENFGKDTGEVGGQGDGFLGGDSLF